MQRKFSTPEQAELAFYEALESSDMGKMEQVWFRDDSIVCIHPGATRLEGWSEVCTSFRQLFREAPDMQFSIIDARCLLLDKMAVHMVREEITVDGQLVSVMLATNIYHFIDNSWRMTLHHASPEPDMEFDELDEFDYSEDIDSPVLLH